MICNTVNDKELSKILASSAAIVYAKNVLIAYVDCELESGLIVLQIT
jgi:hypothetical protein